MKARQSEAKARLVFPRLSRPRCLGRTSGDELDDSLPAGGADTTDDRPD